MSPRQACAPIGPHAHHRGKSRQCGFHLAVRNGEPYRRRIATMSSDFDRELNATVVKLGDPVPDSADFRLQYDPGNPAADKQATPICPM